MSQHTTSRTWSPHPWVAIERKNYTRRDDSGNQESVQCIRNPPLQFLFVTKLRLFLPAVASGHSPLPPSLPSSLSPSLPLSLPPPTSCLKLLTRVPPSCSFILRTCLLFTCFPLQLVQLFTRNIVIFLCLYISSRIDRPTHPGNGTCWCTSLYLTLIKRRLFVSTGHKKRDRLSLKLSPLTSAENMT